MVSGHGGNPISLITKKIKIGRPEPPTPLRPITSHFCLTPKPPASLKVDTICVSPQKVHLDLLQSFLKIKLKAHSQFSKNFVDTFCSPSSCGFNHLI